MESNFSTVSSWCLVRAYLLYQIWKKTSTWKHAAVTLIVLRRTWVVNYSCYSLWLQGGDSALCTFFHNRRKCFFNVLIATQDKCLSPETSKWQMKVQSWLTLYIDFNMQELHGWPPLIKFCGSRWINRKVLFGKGFHVWWTFADAWRSWKIKAITHKNCTTDRIIKQPSNGLPTVYWTDEKSILTWKEKE